MDQATNQQKSTDNETPLEVDHDEQQDEVQENKSRRAFPWSPCCSWLLPEGRSKLSRRDPSGTTHQVLNPKVGSSSTDKTGIPAVLNPKVGSSSRDKTGIPAVPNPKVGSSSIAETGMPAVPNPKVGSSSIAETGISASFWLSKSTGKKCYMLCARELSIAWKDNPSYWSWTSLPESRFPEVAELLTVCWLDIRGTMPARLLSLKTNYAAYLVFKTTENSYGLEAVAKALVSFAATTGTSSSSARTSDPFEPEGDSVYLKTPTLQDPFEHEIGGRVPCQRNDGWQEILLGEFLNDEGDGDIEIKVSETEILNWKRGLILEGIELRPKEEV